MRETGWSDLVNDFVVMVGRKKRKKRRRFQSQRDRLELKNVLAFKFLLSLAAFIVGRVDGEKGKGAGSPV